MLTFTGVSALQACVNPPLAHMAEERVAASIQAVVDVEEESEVDEVSLLRALFSEETPARRRSRPRRTGSGREQKVSQ